MRLGLPDAARPALVAALARLGEGALLAVVATPAAAQVLSEELRLFVRPQHVLRLPESERLPYEFGPDDEAVRYERERALAALRAGDGTIVVASWSALSQHCAPPAAESDVLHLSRGDEQPPQALLSRLEALGYQAEPVADRPGSVARHGGIIDVFPPGAENPVRLEFFGNEIDSIRYVVLETQRSTGRIDTIDIPAAATGGAESQSRAESLVGELEATGDAAEAVIEAFETIAAGGRIDARGFAEMALFDMTALAHLGNSTRLLVIDEAGGFAALEAQYEQEQRARHELEQRGSIPGGLPPLRMEPAEFARKLHEADVAFVVEPFGDETTRTRRLPLRVTPAFGGRLRPFLQQASAWARSDASVVVASQQALRLHELFAEEGIEAHLLPRLTDAPERAAITLLNTAAGAGFSIDDQLVFVTDAEIFGFRKQRRPTRVRRGVRSDLLATIEPGDYLVHVDHGIARFGGMVKREANGVEREYLELLYAEGDRLFVPADSLESVTKYIGPGDQRPAMTRLGSGEWQRAKRRARQSVLELAEDLIQLYAKRAVAQGFPYPSDHPWQMEMEAAFPFVETNDQAAAISEVKRDMESPRPMDRLLCGDVGYGKTEVAVRAAFKAVMAGKQVAVLVPTTVLAEQHGRTFRERTAGFPVRVEVLSRFRSDEEQREITAGLRSGEIDVVVGTHRLLQADVAYKDLGLVIVDEEQRFGVGHKERLKQMREEVDVLTLSATPIPRTLQMSLVGIRDMSTIMTPPEERQPIRTYVTEWDAEIVREAIERELQRGGQVYFVHNRVHNIEMVMARLREIVPEARFAIGHGQMPEEILERVMTDFAAGEYDVLVCTTIIESGLDMPNVNTIIINDANQLGLSQLYQLRGRVGRASNQAYAYLLYDRSRAVSETAQKRLEAIFEATELGAGFQIALRDLEIRGAGNVLGTAQSGHIAAVGFELYSKLVAEAVAVIKQAYEDRETPVVAPPPAAPTVDLPVSAHIPESYLDDMNQRLALYQRVASIESAAEVAVMQEELRDRFGPVPPALEHLLFVALVKAMGRRARLESIKTSEVFIHLRVRNGTTEAQRRAVSALKLPGVLPGPNQVRIDRVAAGEQWIPILTKVLRAMRVEEEVPVPAA